MSIRSSFFIAEISSILSKLNLYHKLDGVLPSTLKVKCAPLPIPGVPAVVTANPIDWPIVVTPVTLVKYSSPNPTFL